MLSEAVTAEQIVIPAAEQNSIFAAGAAHAVSAVAAITMGFSTDPVARWFYPEPAQYFAWFPRFIRAFAGAAIGNGTAYCAPGFAGAAMWLAPGVCSDDDAIIALVWDSIPDEKQSAIFSLFEQMGAGHPDEPHWYLPMIGVDTIQQGNGIGSSLMQYALDRVDEDGVPAYLESSNPRNISLYRRFGFEVVGEIQAGGSPPLIPMLRKARS
jgi:ribosomal protein S18 acetylase RimI-like enzyme